jgi:hypothetical protein
MTTKNEMVALLKTEFPTLQIGNDEDGYTPLSKTDYEAKILEWANERLAQEADVLAIKEAEAQKAAILTKLGITADELRVALS